MARERLYLFDTTLRDGALTTGVDFSLDDKRNIAAMLERLGIDYVEGGYPGANPLDTEFFGKKPTKRARFCAFGMTKRPGRSVGNDPGVAGLLASDSDAIVYVAKSWDYHVHVALGCTLEENLDSIAESVRAAVDPAARRWSTASIFSTDTRPTRHTRSPAPGCRSRPGRAGRCSATPTGARCRTRSSGSSARSRAHSGRPSRHPRPQRHRQRGGQFDRRHPRRRPADARYAERPRRALRQRQPRDPRSRRWPSKTSSPTASKPASPRNLRKLTPISRAFDELLNRSPNRHAPYVGASAFATKAGIHASALAKDPRTYEHVTPESVGNKRVILISDQAGRSNLLSELNRLGIEADAERSARDPPARHRERARGAGLRL